MFAATHSKCGTRSLAISVGSTAHHQYFGILTLSHVQMQLGSVVVFELGRHIVAQQRADHDQDMDLRKYFVRRTEGFDRQGCRRLHSSWCQVMPCP